MISLISAVIATHTASAGQIRRIDVSEDHPATVVLALGRTTAISFFSRPEKVVPGSPQALQVNFLGSDVTVTPVSQRPGNLLVYTKTSRYVIVFRLGNDANYDDVVRVGAVGRSRPLRLLTDSFRVARYQVRATAPSGQEVSKIPTSLALRLTSDGQELIGPEVSDLLGLLPGQVASLRCVGCVIHGKPGAYRIRCITPIEWVQCKSQAVCLSLEQEGP